MRCFIAIDVPAEVRAAVARAQSEIRDAVPRADVRWVATAQVHLTLKFLGAVPDAQVPAVSAALDGAVAGTAPVAIAVSGLGGFPSLRSARVLWAGLTEGVSQLTALALSVERAMAVLGFPPEARPFRGHLTIGRVRSPRGARALGTAVEAVRASALGSWTASEIVLYQSQLRPTGAVHTPVSRHGLRG